MLSDSASKFNGFINCQKLACYYKRGKIDILPLITQIYSYSSIMIIKDDKKEIFALNIPFSFSLINSTFFNVSPEHPIFTLPP